MGFLAYMLFEDGIDVVVTVNSIGVRQGIKGLGQIGGAQAAKLYFVGCHGLRGLLRFAACGGAEKFAGDGDPAACAGSYDAIRQPRRQILRPLRNRLRVDADGLSRLGNRSTQQIEGLVFFHAAMLAPLQHEYKHPNT